MKLAEYAAAQEMVRHYDTLNWQIGSILIGANAVLFGVVAGILGRIDWPGGFLVATAVAGFSAFLLLAWRLWYKRHRALYNFRHETMHRIELQLGMYHHLRVAWDPSGRKAQNVKAVERQVPAARDAAQVMYGEYAFEPLYTVTLEKTQSGDKLAKHIWWVMPSLEFLALVLVVAAKHA